jgi:hypothetical protein
MEGEKKSSKDGKSLQQLGKVVEMPFAGTAEVIETFYAMYLSKKSYSRNFTDNLKHLYTDGYLLQMLLHIGQVPYLLKFQTKHSNVLLYIIYPPTTSPFSTST